MKIKQLFIKFEKEYSKYIFKTSISEYFSLNLSDGKTFLYYSSREGKISILRYLIEERKLDYSILSIIDENKFESNLEVASRWEQFIIVKYLLILPSYNNFLLFDKSKINKLILDNNFLNELTHNDKTYSIEIINKAISKSRNKNILKILKSYKKKFYDKYNNYCI